MPINCIGNILYATSPLNGSWQLIVGRILEGTGAANMACIIIFFLLIKSIFVYKNK
jgi:hypothetical protein